MITLCVALFASLTSIEPTQRACFEVANPFAFDCRLEDECEAVTWWERDGTYVVQLEYVLPR